MYSLMFDITQAPASRIMTDFLALPSSWAIKAPAKPDPTIPASHSTSALVAIAGLLRECSHLSDVFNKLGRVPRPVAERQLTESHRMSPSHLQSPALCVCFRRNDLESRRRNLPLVILQLLRVVPTAQVPHQNNAAPKEFVARGLHSVRNRLPAIRRADTFLGDPKQVFQLHRMSRTDPVEIDPFDPDRVRAGTDVSKFAWLQFLDEFRNLVPGYFQFCFGAKVGGQLGFGYSGQRT